MTDLVKILIMAGDGGHGRVSFRREKYVPRGGPDGGRGGRGGDVLIRATKHLATLDAFAGKTKFQSMSGQGGGKRKKIGGDGESLILEVPLGTKIWVVLENEVARRRRQNNGIDSLLKRVQVKHAVFNLDKEGQSPPTFELQEWLKTNGEKTDLSDEVFGQSASFLLRKNNQQLVDLLTLENDGDSVVLAQGGFGGYGNEHFKGPARTTPLIAQYGTEGEKRLVLLEHKLLADVGLAGFPNVGKSTLLSVLTKARPKVAAYPFTTLEPNLGVMPAENLAKRGKTEVVIADIPGLIEGASEGKGLGHQFLRHIENSVALCVVLALDEVVVFDQNLTDLERAGVVWDQYQKLLTELKLYNRDLLAKKRMVVINKQDIYSDDLKKEIETKFTQELKQDLGVSSRSQLIFISAATLEGIDELKTSLVEMTK